NPNKSKVFIGHEVMNAAKHLKVICTASTGTVHIDKHSASEKGILILSLTEQREVIERISSTAEHAFALTLSTLRNVHSSHTSVLDGEWDYSRYIGRQMNCLTVGIVGYGRLGSKYAKYCKAFDSNVLVFDPYKKVDAPGISQLSSLEDLLIKSDIVSIHVHVTPETTQMFSDNLFSLMKKDVILINTARGEVLDEDAAVRFLKKNTEAKYATDVLADEQRNRRGSPILQFAKKSNQVIITPHIGGMTREAQEIAYGHAAQMLANFWTNQTH
ncbi:MAG: hydroxyacid dehydrogenase, partial [Proteobacteria bacterium]